MWRAFREKEMQISEARMGEIAIAWLTMRFEKEGLRLGLDFHDRAAETAAAIGVETDELIEFTKLMTVRMLGRAYRKHVSLKMTEPIVSPDTKSSH
jgi:hypothetical protein